MKLDTILQRIPLWYQAGFSPCLESSPGMGKTETVSSAPRLLSTRFGGDYGLVVMNGGNLETTDTTGYLFPKDREGVTYSEFSRPWWWTTDEGHPLERYKGGVIFVDEYDKAPVDVKKVLGEACLSGRLCMHTLPGDRTGESGWRIWLAGNRSDDRSGSTKNLDHLINRIRPFSIDPDLDSWTNWATKKGLMPVTIGFANSNPAVVFEGKVPEKQGPWCTPRSLAQCDSYMQLLVGPDGEIPFDDGVVRDEIAAFIGAGAGMQFANTIKLQQSMPKFERIIADPTKVKVPEAPDAQMLVCYDLAFRVDENTAKPVITYVERMAKEFSVTFARAACNRAPKLVSTPAFNAWCKANSALMAVISKPH